jgi:hypothetical protein
MQIQTWFNPSFFKYLQFMYIYTLAPIPTPSQLLVHKAMREEGIN